MILGRHIRYLLTGFFTAVVLLQPRSLEADPVAVRYVEGTLHGFLVLRAMDGKTLAAGDLTQSVKGDQVTTHVVFRFKDGSVDDETAVFSQKGQFRLISDRHIQKGPSFPHPTDVTIASTGEVTVRSKDHKGQEKVDTDQLDLPDDLANGMLLTVLKNFPGGDDKIKVSYLAATPKPRIVKLAINPEGEEPFSIAGSGRKATHYVVKVELGGITGVVAPIVGKQPEDIHIWMLGGQVPAFVKLEAPSYFGGPIWSTQVTGPVWPRPSKESSQASK